MWNCWFSLMKEAENTFDASLMERLRSVPCNYYYHDQFITAKESLRPSLFHNAKMICVMNKLLAYFGLISNFIFKCLTSRTMFFASGGKCKEIIVVCHVIRCGGWFDKV